MSHFAWYNADTGTPVGSSNGGTTVGANSAPLGAQATAIVTPSVDTRYELKVDNIGVTGLSGDAYIECLTIPATVVKHGGIHKCEADSYFVYQ